MDDAAARAPRPHVTVIPWVVLVVLVAAAAGATVATVAEDSWTQLPNATTPPALAVLFAGLWLAPVATIVLLRWRPTSRPWKLMAALSLTWSTFVVAVTTPLSLGGLFNTAMFIRPLAFFVLLSWPSGHLRQRDRTWLATYSVLQAILFWAVSQLFGRYSSVAVADVDRVVILAGAVALTVVLPVGAIILVVSIRRHVQTLPRAGVPLIRPILAAAWVILVAELALVANEFVEGSFGPDGEPRLVGGLVLTFSYVVVPAVAVAAIVASRRAAAAARETHDGLELGSGENLLRGRLTTMLDREGASVVFRGPDGAWIDGAGRAVDSVGPGAVVEIRRRDAVVAAVRFPAGGSPAPDAVERIVAATGASVEFARLEALANARRAAADAARAEVEAAYAGARTRLERDLHDGAQQRLVALALRAAVARRGAEPDDIVAAGLSRELDAVRRELADAASGVLPALVVDRGLAGSIGTLAATAALDVTVDLHYPAALPADVAAAAWFVVAEAVANATKHADATRLCISGRVRDGWLDVVVGDDGRGGADARGTGLAGLSHRVERAGGSLVVESPPGGGTVIGARFALAAPSANGDAR